ncbi:TetR family transcriptional regulator [Nocardioides ochotonae]|uniref:TetR family transcriptional regulator n=1 Tax=Nocardioides ochotonae TaxID=2685869 RepID=UPI00140E846C|nr:TetR family transcriptional regulator [Nocardioides ochotonae]
MSSQTTRQALIDAACRAFAENGVERASLLEITRQAGQRNRGAVHYHFGSRAGMLVAVLEEQVEFLQECVGDLLARAEARPGELEPLVDAFVEPAVALAAQGWKGQCLLRIVAELLATESETSLPPEVYRVIASTRVYEVSRLLDSQLAALPPAVRELRTTLTIGFAVRAVAERAKGQVDSPQIGWLDDETFEADLKAMCLAMLSVAAPAGSTG